MDVCPYCKKPFKRLKSHLPHCKMIKLTVPAAQNVCRSEQATLPHAKKRRSPVKDFPKAKERELGTKSEKRNSKLRRDKPERTAEPFPLPALGLERAGDPEAGADDLKNQSQLSLKIVRNPDPEITFTEEAKAPKRELAKDLPQSGESQSYPSQTKAPLPLGPTEPSLSNQDRRYSSALPDGARATAAKLTLDTMDPSKQKLLVKLLDMPAGDYHSSPRKLNYGDRERERTSHSSAERESKARDHLSGVYIDVRDSEEEKSTESQLLGFQVSRLGKAHVQENPGKGLDLGVGARGSKGHTQDSVPAMGMQACPSGSSSSEGFEKKSRGEGPRLDLFTPRQTVCNEFLSVSQPRNQSLASLAIKFLQEEKAEACDHNRVPDGKALMEGAGQAFLEPRSGCAPQALPPECQPPFPSTQRCASKSLFTGQVDIADAKTLPRSLGLEWFPELYPGYLGLGVLPGKPQYWNSVAQKPQLISPQGERLSQGKYAHFPGPSSSCKLLCLLK